MNNPLAIPMNDKGIGFDWQTFSPRGGPRQLVRFEWRHELDVQASRMEGGGRPIYRKVEFVCIQMPGEILQIIEKPATDEHRARWPREYEAHLKATAYVPDGTPIEFLFATQPQVVAMLKSGGVHVVEDLASLTANGIQGFGMGAQDWVNKAKDYLEKAQKGVDYHQIAQMKESHEREMTSMQNQLADQQRQMANLIAELRATAPDYVSGAAASAAAQARSQPASPALPAVPLKDPNAWNAPSADAVDRRSIIEGKVRNRLRESAKNDQVTFKEGE